MIITLTLNPAIDHTVVIDRLVPGDTNRVKESRTDPGGKGINVSRVLKELGCPSLAMGFVSGARGRFIEQSLNDLGIIDDFIHTPGQTRTNVTIIDRDHGTTTTFSEPGPPTPPHYVSLLTQRLKKHLHPGDWLVVGGSIPPPFPPTVYGEIISLAKERGTFTVLDADGEALARGLEAKPLMVKPNRRELQRLLGREPRKESTLLEAALKIHTKGVEAVVISQGYEGAVASTPQGNFRAYAPEVGMESTVGAGDAMVAGIILILSQGGNWEEALRLGTAAGTAVALTPGTQLCRKEDVQRLLPQVRIKLLPS